MVRSPELTEAPPISNGGASVSDDGVLRF